MSFSNVIGSPLGAFTIADERYFNLFDQDMERKYYSDESPVFNVEVELDKPYRLDYYTLTSCQDYPRETLRVGLSKALTKTGKP